VSVAEALALLLALPEAMVALCELWAHRCTAGHAMRPKAEIAVKFHINFRLNLRLNLRR
jgi:hypothetical protein